jgi:hypothetical protein
MRGIGRRATEMARERKEYSHGDPPRGPPCDGFLRALWRAYPTFGVNGCRKKRISEITNT